MTVFSGELPMWYASVGKEHFWKMSSVTAKPMTLKMS